MNRPVFFLLGIASGTVAGLLYAPQPGRRTRAMIASKSKQGQRFLRDQSAKLRDGVEDTFGCGRVAITRSMRHVLG